LGAAAYGYKPAFKNSPTAHDLKLFQDILMATWGDLPVVVDPTAGGGSIPYEALRYGLATRANDLNPVAAAVLRAGLELPSRFGLRLGQELRTWGGQLVERVRARLLPFFELPDSRSDNNSYIFARTVMCPRTGKPVPLAPNWWLSTGSTPVAVKVITERDGRPLGEAEFQIVQGDEIDFDPNNGSVSGGDAVSPWDNLAIDGDYIKAEAQAGRLTSQLYAVAVRTPAGRGFRAPTQTDLAALRNAEDYLRELKPGWVAANVLPNEEIDRISNYDRGHRLYGIRKWVDFLSPRQLLVHGVFVEEYRTLVDEIRGSLDGDVADAVLGLLGLMLPKALRFDCIQSRWHAGNVNIVPIFDRHGYAFKWTYAEFEGARELYPWCLDQVIEAYEGIAELLKTSDDGLLDTVDAGTAGTVAVSCNNAANLVALAAGSATLVCIDPPYYDNVMYAELADFFYVWEKRTLGLVWPELYQEVLTDKKNEAVANPARFADAGKRRHELANADYEAKMTAIFAECHRILADNGVMTVMFTHKKAEAWDTLGMALMEAGFTIETSWPVNTESEQSLHQANKNSAASTIFLVCRKRAERGSGHHPFFEDLEADVRHAVRAATMRFSEAGISGVDLLLSTYGPALSVISSQWPVYSSEADSTGRSRLLRPEQALDAARAEVVRIQRQRLVGLDVQLDPLTDFALIAWDNFRAVEFPFDEARRLALATGGLDVDELVRAKVLEKKSGSVVLLPPAKRLRRAGDDLPGVRPGATTFPCTLDAVHTVMYIADTDGMASARALLDRASLAKDGRFLACLQGLINAVPRTKLKGKWVRSEAETLDRICAAYFPDIAIPPDPGEAEVLTLF
jgi:adenine-specific DNA methylase